RERPLHLRRRSGRQPLGRAVGMARGGIDAPHAVEPEVRLRGEELPECLERFDVAVALENCLQRATFEERRPRVEAQGNVLEVERARDVNGITAEARDSVGPQRVERTKDAGRLRPRYAEHLA